MFAALMPGLMALIAKLIPDPQAAADAQLKLLSMQQAGQLAELKSLLQRLRATGYKGHGGQS